MALTANSALPLQKETTMPSNEIMPMFKKHRLHSGSSDGPVVTNPHQAKAIQLSYLRKEGHDIPKKGEGKEKKRKSIGQMIAEG